MLEIGLNALDQEKEKKNKMKKKYLFILPLILFFTFFPGLVQGQPQEMNGAELAIALDKLLKLGSVLYIAAHPDDENTAVLAYMARERKLRTGYLSINRGDGGQNLIGSEKGERLSILRTYELLAARSIDQAEQFFTRAIDFGYSKTAEESLQIWGKNEILDDLVYVIRLFQPDVILMRFSTENSGHGHHTASAILSLEAFNAAGDPTKFPGHLSSVQPWQPKRLFWDSWRPFYEKPDEAYMQKLLTIDVGTFNPLLGKSYYEIASLSRSMHKTQGFGSVPRRGQVKMYFEHMAGEPAQTDIMDGIDTSWNRVPGSAKLQQLLQKAHDNFNPAKPWEIIDTLMLAQTEMKRLPPSYWTIQKAKECRDVIRLCSGLWLEAIVDQHSVTGGSEIKIKITAIARSGFPMTWLGLKLPGPEGKTITVDKPLPANLPLEQEVSFKIPANTPFTHPFWLKEKPGKGIYAPTALELKGLAIAQDELLVTVVMGINGGEIAFDIPLQFRWRDPVAGERLRDLIVMPPAVVNFTETVCYFTGNQPVPRAMDMILRSGPTAVQGELKLKLPAGWLAEPPILPFSIDTPFTEKKVSVMVTPPVKDMSCQLGVEVKTGNGVYQWSQEVMQYDHLPLLTFHPLAEAQLVRVKATGGNGKRVGYIMGPGDDIPLYLGQVGYIVDELSDEDLRQRDLSVYKAVIAGVRAYNTRDILKHVQKRLLDYVAEGGCFIVQYNVSRDLLVPEFGPYPLKLSSDRVTEEDAPITILNRNHRLFLVPNKIESNDFAGWVQERGLYFANEWDNAYTPLLSCNDKGEEPRLGGLLVAKYGKGVFIYTGYAFFRQLPGGVPGALKLFVNMIELK